MISGNSTASISDHLPEFVIIPNIFGNISGNKYNIYEGTDQNWIDKILFLTVSLLTGRIC